MQVEKGAHCQYQIRYHIVWGVKYRRKLLFGERIRYLKHTLYEIAARYEYTIEAVGTDDDHVHVFAGAHPAVPPAQLIQVLKSISAKELFREYPEIKRFLWGGAFWSIGYYVRTVSDGPLEDVIKTYVENQGKKSNALNKRSYQLELVA